MNFVTATILLQDWCYTYKIERQNPAYIFPYATYISRHENVSTKELRKNNFLFDGIYDSSQISNEKLEYER